MKIVKKSEARSVCNGKDCLVIEYPLGFNDINGAVGILSGRYPSKGYATNSKCKELVYVIAGSGILVVNGETLDLKEGDLVCVEPGEKYYFDAHMTIFMPCVPAWNENQYKISE
jgi:mannose-6-phosphate isomerase-like protein (cupin superfamily)